MKGSHQRIENKKMENTNTFKEAPPTRKPSISSFFASSAQLPPLTDPTSIHSAKSAVLHLPNIARDQSQYQSFVS